jgi:outer membrane protein assembly factor BamB
MKTLILLAALGFSDLSGWWSAEPSFGGETSQVALHFVESEGRQEARISILAIGGFEFPLGEVTIAGDTLDTKGLSFPLRWNPETRTLSGVLPADAVPVYRIPIEFRRSEPIEKPKPREWSAPRPRVVWSVETGGAPVWAGLERDAKTGDLFVGDENGVLYAIDRAGTVRWKVETGKPIRAQPRLLAKTLYAHSDSGFLHALDPKNGAERWKARVDAGAAPRIPTNQDDTRYDRYGSSVVSDGKRLFIASRDRNLYALDPKSGRELWRVTAGDLMTATPAIYRDTVIFAAFDGKVSAVSAKDGKPRWSYDAKLAVPGDLTVAGDRVLVGSRSYDLIALDAATGKEQWKHYYWFSWIESPPVVRDGVAYTGSSDAVHVFAVDVSDGSLRWKAPVPGWSWQRTAVTDDLVIAGTAGIGAFPGARAGALVALRRDSGAIHWIYLDPPSQQILDAKKGWGFGASPVVADGLVYAADLNGKVFAIELK